MILSDKQINDELAQMKQEQAKIEEDIMKTSVYSDGLISVSESYSLPVPTKKLFVKTLVAKREALSNNK